MKYIINFLLLLGLSFSINPISSNIQQRDECEDFSQDECYQIEWCEWNYETGECSRIENDFHDDDWSCSDLEDENDCIDMGCTWLESNNMIGGGSCTESQDEFDCNPDLACATVLTCYEGLLYPTSCGPENCDEPIGECDDNNEEGCFEEGEWYDYGQEIFISDCEYLECTPNGWSGPFTLYNEDCSDNNDDWDNADNDW